MQETPVEPPLSQDVVTDIATAPVVPSYQSISAPAPKSDNEVLSWTASEFIAHQKTNLWYVVMAGSTLVLAVICYLVTHDIVTTSIVIIAAIMLSIFAGREPRQVHYQVSTQGLSIANKFYAMHAFRAFSVVPEGAFSSIVLSPINRFSTPVTLYFAPEDEDRLISLLGNQLPIMAYKHDVIERILRKIRF